MRKFGICIMKAELNCMRWISHYIVVWFAAWCGMLVAMDESVVDWFVEDADTPVLLLEGYGCLLQSIGRERIKGTFAGMGKNLCAGRFEFYYGYGIRF